MDAILQVDNLTRKWSRKKHDYQRHSRFDSQG